METWIKRRLHISEEIKMKRLTVRDENGNVKLAKNDVENIVGILLEVIDRLAAYEDLGITAEQVREIDKAYTELCEELAKYSKIGTAEEFEVLKEKSEPKRVDEDSCCPICHTYGKDDNGVAGEYCPNCG